MSKRGSKLSARKLWWSIATLTSLVALVFWLLLSFSPKPLRLIRTWKAHKLPINDLSFLPDGQHLLSASWDGTIRVWKVSDGTKTDELSLGRPIRFATLSPDGQLPLMGIFWRQVS